MKTQALSMATPNSTCLAFCSGTGMPHFWVLKSVQLSLIRYGTGLTEVHVIRGETKTASSDMTETWARHISAMTFRRNSPICGPDKK